VWGAATSGEPVWYIFVSRVMERTAVFTVGLYEALLAKLDLSSTRVLKFWSDAGTHFRNYTVLGALGVTIPEQYKLSTAVNFGPESHFKNPADGQFAVFDNSVSDWTQRNEIHDEAQLVHALQADYELRKAQQPLLAEEKYFNFVPPERSSIVTKTINPKSLPANLTSCHCWSFTYHDKRRKAVTNSLGVVTGIHTRAHMIDPDSKVAADHLCFAKIAKEKKPKVPVDAPAEAPADAPVEGPVDGPVDAPADAPAEAPVDAPADAPAEAPVDAPVEGPIGIADVEHDHATEALAFETAEINGWKCSYKKLQPELQTVQETTDKLKRKFKTLANYRPAHIEVIKTRTQAMVAASAAKTAARTSELKRVPDHKRRRISKG
jgi:hypothetical protein